MVGSDSCCLCGRGCCFPGGYLVTVSSHGHGWVCDECVTRSLADVADALRRAEEAKKFANQAKIELAELTRDPGQCKERIRLSWEERIRVGDIDRQFRFCSRRAKHDDGYCTQHHEQEEAGKRFRENPHFKLRPELPS